MILLVGNLLTLSFFENGCSFTRYFVLSWLWYSLCGKRLALVYKDAMKMLSGIET